MFWDPTFILLIPAMILAIWAQAILSRTFSNYSRVRSGRGITASRVARGLLDSAGLSNVTVERVAGNLSDHYDPRSKILRLSDSVYASDSVAAIGVAAHEAGHAMQHAEGYSPLAIRNAILPVVNIGSFAAWPIFILGLFLHTPFLLQLGIILFSGAVLFQVITLPVEFNASQRALAHLREKGFLMDEEISGAKRVLDAAAMTYVAATAAAITQLLRMILLSRRD
jgi:uncharacterized protein